MRIIILLIGLLTFQADFNPRFYLEVIDLTTDGKYLAGISPTGIIVMETATKKVIARQEFEKRSRLLNIRISGDGKYLFWTRNWEMYHAALVNNEITNIEQLNVVKPWLNLEVNYDGSQILLTQDFPNRSKYSCSPGKRLILHLKRDGNPFSYHTVGSTVEDCLWLSNCQLLPDGNILYLRNQGRKNPPQKSIIEATPEGKSWNYQVLKDSVLSVPRQPISENDDLLIADCSFYILKKDTNQIWQKEVILPTNDNCMANWNAGISPNGKTVIYLKNHSSEDKTHIAYSEFWITQKVKNEWTTPVLLFKPDDPRMMYHLADFRLSNTNFVYCDRNGDTYLISTLDGKNERIKLEKSMD